MTGFPHVLVTGGAGFIGSHLVDSLLADGYRVTSLDNFGSGRATNLEHVDSDSFRSLDHDVSEPFPDFETVECIYHFASRASPADFESHAVEIARTNSLGTVNVLECAREHDATVVLASTSEVYGEPAVHPQPESYNGNVSIRGPRAPYDESKRFAEALAVAYEQQYSIDIRTVRIFNTYGPRMSPDDGRVIPNFVSQALRGDDLTVYGDGSQTRSFCYVTDLVSAIRVFADLPAAVAAGEVINVGSPDEVTISTLVDLVLEVVETDSNVRYEPLPQDDPTVRRPDLSRINRLLEWEPAVDLETGLERTVKAFRGELDVE